MTDSAETVVVREYDESSRSHDANRARRRRHELAARECGWNALSLETSRRQYEDIVFAGECCTKPIDHSRMSMSSACLLLQLLLQLRRPAAANGPWVLVECFARRIADADELALRAGWSIWAMIADHTSPWKDHRACSVRRGCP